MIDAPLVCLRASQYPNPPPVKSHRDYCSLCGALVIVADSSPDVETIWCWECAGEEIEKAHRRKEKVSYGVTPRQLADLAAHWNKR